MKNLNNTVIKRVICVLLTVAILCANTGATVYATEGTEQKVVEETLPGDIQAEEVPTEEPSVEYGQNEEASSGEMQTEDSQIEEPPGENDQAEGNVEEDEETEESLSEDSLSEEMPVEEGSTSKENAETDVTEGNPVSENNLEDKKDNIASGEYKENGNNITWVIDADGKLTVEGTGDYADLKYNYYRAPWSDNRKSIISAEINVTGMTDASTMFYGCSNLISVDLSNFDTSQVTSMTNMFGVCQSLANLNLSNFDTSKVTNMGCMFDACTSLTSLDLSSFDTTRVVNMSNMFANCQNLTNLNISSFDTSQVTSMNCVFNGCNNLTSLDVSKFDTSKVKFMEYMFNGCSSLTRLDVSGFDTSQVTTMECMFRGCSQLSSLDTSNFDTSHITNMTEMFKWCNGLTSLDLENFDTSNITDMDNIFNECSKLLILHTPYNLNLSVALPSGTWYQTDGTQITELPQNLDHSILIKKNEIPIVSAIKAAKTKTDYVCGDTINVDDLTVTYYDANSIGRELEKSDYTTNAGKIDMSTAGKKTLIIKYNDGENVITDEIELTVTEKEPENIIASGEYKENGNNITWIIDADGKLTVEGTGDFAKANTYSYAPWYAQRMSIKSAEINVTGMTDTTHMFDGCENLTNLDLSSFDTSQVTNMYCMFSHCRNLTELDLSNFDTHRVTNMSHMFDRCENLTNLDLSSFDTSQVTNMYCMFSYCSNLTSLNVSKFATSQVTDMSSMFYGCSELANLDLNSFDTGNVTDMNWMFGRCSNLASLDLKNFSTSQVTNMSVMFYYCSNLTNLDMSNFDTSQVTNMRSMFSGCSNLTNLDLSKFDVNQVTDISSMLPNNNKLHTICTPYNLNLSVALPSGTWYQTDGTQITELPKNLDHSILIKKNEIPIVSAIKAAKTKTDYVCGDTINIDDLTVTYYDANSIGRELEKSDYTTNADKIDMSTAGKKTLIIKYNDGENVITDEIELTVTEKEPENIIASGEYKENGNNITWIIDADGKLTVEGTGDFASPIVDIYIEQNKTRATWVHYQKYNEQIQARAPWYDYKDSIISAKINVTGITDASFMFRNCSNLTSVDMIGFDTKNVSNMAGIFSYCKNLTNLDLKNFNTENVTDMSAMFDGCSSLTNVDVSGFKTDKVTDMGIMFQGCRSLTSINVSGFDTSNVTNMTGMFGNCSNLTSIDVSDFDTSNVRGINMFYGCSSLMSIDVSNFDTSNVTIMSSMFSGCTSLTSIDMSNFNTGNVTDMSYMFGDCSNLTSLDMSNFDTSNVTVMSAMFQECSSLTSIDMSNFNTGNVTDMSYMFDGCSNLTSLDMSNFNTINVCEIDSFFSGCSNLTLIHTPYNLKCQVSLPGETTDIWYDKAGNEYVELPQNIGYRLLLAKNTVPDLGENIASGEYKENGNDITWVIDADGILTIEGTGDFSDPEYHNFDRAPWYVENESIKYAKVNVTGMTDASYMFYGCSNLTNLDMSDFNANNINKMDSIFFGCSNLAFIHTPYNLKCQVSLPRKITDIWYDKTGNKYVELPQNINYSLLLTKNPEEIIASGEYKENGNDITWKIDVKGNLTVEGTGDFSDPEHHNSDRAPWYVENESIKYAKVNVTGMTDASYMFYGCSNLVNLDVSSFDTNQVTDMSKMFSGCGNLTSSDLSSFDTSKVTNMIGMFSDCSSLTNLDLSSFDTSQVTNMSNMFYECWCLTNLDLSSFDTSQVTNMSNMFYECCYLTNLDLSSFDTSQVTDMSFMFYDCDGLTSLDLSGFDMNKVTNIRDMFDFCYSLTTIHTPYNLKCQVSLPGKTTDIWYDEDENEYIELPQNIGYSLLLKVTASGTYKENGNDITWTIDGDGNLIVEGIGDFSDSRTSRFDIPWYYRRASIKHAKINVTGMTDASYMFLDCKNLISVELDGFDTSKVFDMTRMFEECSSLSSLDLSGFDTNKVLDMSWMFYGCSSLSSLDLSGFDTNKVSDMSWMFYGCSSLSSLDLSGFDTNKVSNMSFMFYGCGNLTSLDLSSFDTSKVTRIYSMFNGCSSLSSLDLSSFDTSQVPSMGKMFEGCSSLSSLDLSSFDTSQVSDMEKMFYGCSSLLNLDLSSFDTSKGPNMERMFSGCPNLALIHTPYNLKYQVPLPGKTTDIWYDETGNEYVELPQNIGYSLLLTKNTALNAENVTITMSDTYDYVYDGKAKTPEVTVAYTVSDDSISENSVPIEYTTILEKDTDYTVTYENNINAFEDCADLQSTPDAPVVIITGQNKYSGMVRKAFAIQKAAAPKEEEQAILIQDCNTPQEGRTLDISGCFADFDNKTGYTVGIPIEDDIIADNVLSGDVSVDEKGILTYSTNAGKAGDFVVIPVTVSFANYRDAVLNVKIIFDQIHSGGLTIAMPVANPESGRQIAAGSKVALTCDTPRAEIYYTAGNNEKALTDPTKKDIRYTEPITINENMYIKAAAIRGDNRSRTVTLHYTVVDTKDKVLKPYAVPGQGAVEEGTKVELKSDTPDAVIYYVTGQNADMLGAVPVDDAHKYTEPIGITGNVAVKAIAHKEGMEDSDFSTFVYKIKVTLDPPTADPVSETIDRGSYISLNADSDTNIYYTVDQSNPITSGSAAYYENKIRVDGVPGSVMVIKAVAEKNGTYSEIVTFTYTISENTVKGLQVMLAGSEEFTYTGSAITPAVIVTNNGVELTEGEDYTVRYSNNIKAADKEAKKAPKITVTGKGNLTRSRSVTFSIKPMDIGDEEVLGGNIVVAEGKTASPILYYGNIKLTAKDYVNPNAKKKYNQDETITITGKGNFEGTRDIDVKVVNKKDMKKFTVIIDKEALKREPLVYDGEEKTLDGYFEVFDTADKTSPLEEYSDYVVIYPKNNINAGKVKFTVVGLGEYYGAVTKSYTIQPKSVKSEADGNMEVNIDDGDTYPFKNGGVVISDLTVTCDGDVLVLGKDYKVTYSSNKNICTNNKAKCTISFKGNYKGSKPLVRRFNISPAVMDDVDQINGSVSVALGDKIYTGKPGTYKSTPYVTVNGVLLKSSDYKVSYYKDPDREQVIDSKIASSLVNLADNDKQQTVYVKIEGKKNYEGTLTAEYNVYRLTEDVIDLAKAKINFVGGNRTEYTGESIEPKIEIMYKSGREWKKVEDNDIGTYITVTYINNMNKGKATVMINGNDGKYAGSKTSIFNIVPKSMK